MTVMIVDDSPEMRGLIREVVAPVADQVVECADGEEFLQRFNVSQPDWTVMDVRMPRRDGLSALREARSQHPDARVLLVTQFPSPALTDSAVAAGAIGCLGKEDLHRILDVLQPSAASR